MNSPQVEHPPLTGTTLVLAATAVSVVAFAEVLDLTIVNVAVPAIAGEFGASHAEGTWAISAYAMSAAAMQPLTGSLCKRFGQIHVFLLATLLFTLASTLCGMAWSLDALVVFRLVQGLVSGPLLPLSQSLMLACFPPEQRGRALGLWASTVLTAPIFGPVLGGTISDLWSWRGCFYINVPVGLFGVVVGWKLLHARNPQPVHERADLIGAALLILGVAATQFMLDHGNQEDWFESPLIRALGWAAVLAFLYFAVWERDEPRPILDFALFRRRSFVVALVGGSLGHATMFSSMVLHPLWLQTTVGYTASDAGLAVMGYGLTAMLASLVYGGIIHRVPVRVGATVGLLAFIYGAVLQAHLTTDATFWHNFWARVPQGIGVPVFQMSMTSLSLTGLPQQRFPAASGLMAFSRTICASFATAMTMWLWEYRAKVHHGILAETTDPLSLAQAVHVSVLSLSEPGGANLVLLERLTQARAMTQAYADVCWLTAWAFALILLLVWVTPTGRPVVTEPDH